MKKIKVKLFQSLLDISVQEYGTTTGVVLIAEANTISITEDLEVDTEILIPAFENIDKKTLKYYSDNNIIPATAQIDEAFNELIEQDEINIDFDENFDEVFG